MSKTIKNKLHTVAACLVSAALCVGSLVACGGNNDGGTTPPETPQHYSAVTAGCTTAGNIEYWTKGGKYYSDEACTTEITQAATVVSALGHDFDGATYVNTDPDRHWQICKRTGCDVTSTKVEHTYTDGACVCGKTETVVTTYDITVNTAEHGTVTADKTTAAAGITVTLTVTPDSGYELDTLVYNDGTDHDIAESKSFTMPEQAVSVTATFKEVQPQGSLDPAEFELWQFDEGDADLGATRTATENTVKVAATAPDGTDWHIKLSTTVDASLMHVYEITYTIKSNVAGEVWFESNDAAYPYRNFTLAVGNNTVKYRFAAGKVESGKANAVLLLGKLPANFEIEVFSMECKEVLSNYAEGWWLDTNSAATANDDYSTGALVITATGSGEGWHLKLAKDVTLIGGHQYELSFVYSVTGGKSGNAKYVVYGEKATVENELCWYNPEYDAGKLVYKTVKFTATDSCTIGSCLEYGEWSNAENPVTITISYVELIDVTPAE